MSTPRAPRPRTTQVSAAARAGETGRRTWIIVAAVVVVGLAGVLAISLAGEESNSAAAVADVAIDGAPLAPYPSEGADPAVGETAPTLAGTALDDTPLTIDPGDGRPKVIAFFAHWCPVCQSEVPTLTSWLDGGGLSPDADLYGVSTGVDPARGNYPPAPWFAREGWTQPTLVDTATSTAALSYGLTAYPYFVAVDADGRVVARATGALSIDAVEQLVDAAIAGGA